MAREGKEVEERRVEGGERNMWRARTMKTGGMRNIDIDIDMGTHWRLETCVLSGMNPNAVRYQSPHRMLKRQDDNPLLFVE